MLDELGSHLTRQYPRIPTPLGWGVCQILYIPCRLSVDVDLYWGLLFVPPYLQKLVSFLIW